ncbi:hypothetical protein F3K32_42565 [Streptomyces sp. LBUM 1483]|uniref:hypothetical protein n=1 Tax=Streptomyces scabiei TaxID=1930 RepID=UPI001B327F87|nr:hypothetical protein [Streptomyces sp. LBUM 1483]MBP5926693.1 hypothetical protein [Streptomyces sp. LBUM 1483]
MRLYSRTGVTALDDPEFGTFTANADGGFDFPDEVSDRVHGFHLHGQPMWETDIERQRRLVTEEIESRKDPATLLSAVEQLVRAAQATAALTPAQPVIPVVTIQPPPPAASVESVSKDSGTPGSEETPAAPAPVEAPAAPAPVEAQAAPAKRASKRTSTKPAE